MPNLDDRARTRRKLSAGALAATGPKGPRFPAPTAARLGAKSIAPVFGMALSTFVLVAAEFLPVSLLSPMASGLRLTHGQAGQALSACALAALVSSLCITKVIQKKDRRQVLLGLISLLLMSGAIVGLAWSFAALLVGRLLLGVAVGGFWSLSGAVAMRLVPPERVPAALALVSGGNALAAATVAPLGSLASGLIGWRGTFLCIVPLSALALAWLGLTFPTLPAGKAPSTRSLGALLRRRSTVIGYGCAVLFFTGQFALFTYLRPFLEEVTHAGGRMLSGLLLILGVAGLIGASVIGRSKGTHLNQHLVALPTIMLAVALALPITGRTLQGAALLLALWGFCSASAPVVWWTWVTRHAADFAEEGGGLLVASAQVGIITGAALGGAVLDAFGPAAAADLAAGFLACAAFSALMLRRADLSTRVT